MSPASHNPMNISEIVSAIDSEISRLQHVRSLLSDAENIGAATKPGRGRPKGSKNASPVVAPKKRTMSEAGRAAIAEGQRRRHAAAKKAKK